MIRSIKYSSSRCFHFSGFVLGSPSPFAVFSGSKYSATFWSATLAVARLSSSVHILDSIIANGNNLSLSAVFLLFFVTLLQLMSSKKSANSRARHRTEEFGFGPDVASRRSRMH
jgi:hypothetical protein